MQYMGKPGYEGHYGAPRQRRDEYKDGEDYEDDFDGDEGDEERRAAPSRADGSSQGSSSDDQYDDQEDEDEPDVDVRPQAPAFKIPSRTISAVEHPFLVMNIDKGLETFGPNPQFNAVSPQDRN